MAFDGSNNVNPTFNAAHGDPIDLTKGGPLLSPYNQAQTQAVPNVDPSALSFSRVDANFTLEGSAPEDAIRVEI